VFVRPSIGEFFCSNSCSNPEAFPDIRWHDNGPRTARHG
jgi:hypothetical protein